MWIAVLLLVIFILFLLWVFALRGRGGKDRFEGIRGFVIAHRGLHDKPSIPENSMSAFARAVEKGYGIELDLHLTSDGRLVVFHDNTLERTTGVEGRLKDRTFSELSALRLEGTDQRIPSFEDLLGLVGGRVPLVIELKAEGNAAALCEATLKALEGYEGYYCIESFDPRPLLWLKKHRPDVVRGQLSQNFLKESSGLNPPLRLLLTSLFLNLAVRPDFVAYNYEHKNDLPFHLSKNLWGVQSFAWTVTDKETAEKLTEEGYIPIFEKFEF